MNTVLREIVAGVGSAGIFLALFVYGMPWWMSLMLATIGSVAIRFLFSPDHRRVRVVLPEGVSREEFDEFISRCKENLEQVRRSTVLISKTEFRDTVNRLCLLAGDLVGNFQKDPEDMRLAVSFPDRLKRLNDMLATYIDLSAQNARSPQSARALETTENAVTKALGKFEMLHDRLMENNAIELSTNAKTLDNLLDFD